MKRYIFFGLFYLFISGADHHETPEHYPLNDDAIYYYGKDYPLSPNDIQDYLSNKNIYSSSQKVFQYDQMPCITIDGIDAAALMKANFIRLDSVNRKESNQFQVNDSIVTLFAELNDRKINYRTTSVISQQRNEFSSNQSGLVSDGVFNCLEIDTAQQNFLVGTGDGKILEYSFDKHKWLSCIKASAYIIDGLWLVKSNKVLIYKSNGYLYFKNRVYDNPLVRIRLPRAFSKIYWDNDNNKVIFSHAGTRVTLIGSFMHTPLDNDFIVKVPKFYIFGEGLSYHHVMFLKMLREIKRLNYFHADSKDKNNKPYISALLSKKHAQLFEPMIAEVFEKYLEEQFSVNF